MNNYITKIFAFLVFFLVAVNFSYAGISDNVVISEVDVRAVSGGEYVELYNPTDNTINISNWMLRTDSQDPDATLPDDTYIAAHSYLLIGDLGGGADHAETITLTDTDAGVSLLNSSNDVIDAVGWGDNDSITGGYEGTPVENPNATSTIQRKSSVTHYEDEGNGWDTDNNTVDLFLIDGSELQNATASSEITSHWTVGEDGWQDSDSLQTVVDLSDTLDFIYIYPGIYQEDVVVNQRLFFDNIFSDDVFVNGSFNVSEDSVYFESTMLYSGSGNINYSLSINPRVSEGNNSNPYDVSSFAANSLITFNRTISLSLDDTSSTSWPISLYYYYTQDDLDRAGINEDQIAGMFRWNESYSGWDPVKDTTFFTENITIGTRTYSGFVRTDLWNFSIYAPAGDIISPVTEDVSVILNVTNSNPTLVANVTDDLLLNFSNVFMAEYFIDVFSGNGNGVNMTPQDGAYDSNSEIVTSTIDLTPYNDGIHLAIVHGMDENYNWGNLLNATFLVDRNGPNVTYISPLNGTNFSNSFVVNITSEDQFTTVDDVHFNVTNNGSEITYPSVKDGIYYSASIDSTALEDGRHIITIVANDTLNNQNDSEYVEILVDNTSPNATIDLPISGQNISGTFLINNTIVDITTLVDDAYFNITNATGELIIQGFNEWNSDWPYDQSEFWYATVDSTQLSDGQHTLTLYTDDSLDNLNSSESVSFVVDNTNPYDVVFLNLVNQSNVTGMLDINMSAADLTSGLETVQMIVALQNGTINYYNVDLVSGDMNSGIYNILYDTNDAPDGLTLFTLIAVDFAGNVNVTEPISLNIDNFGPEYFFDIIDRYPVPSFNNDSVTFNVTVVDNVTEVSSLWLSGNWTGTWTNYSITNNYNDMFEYIVDSSNLENQEMVGYIWYANDSFDHVSESMLQEFLVQNRAPLFNFSMNISDMSWVEDSGSGVVNLSQYFYDLDLDDLNYTVVVDSDPTGGLIVTIDNDTSIATIDSSADWNGFGNVTFYAWDFVGASAASNLVDIVVFNDENEAPTLTSPISPVNFSEDTNIAFTLVCDPNDPGQSCENYRYDPDYVSYDNNVSVSVNSTTGAVYLSATQNWNGITYVRFVADDDGMPVLYDDVIVKINVTAVNDAPEINTTINWTQFVDEDYGTWTYNLSQHKFDIDDNLSDLSWILGSYDTSLLTITYNSTTELLTFETLDNQFGSTQLLLNLSDPDNDIATEYMVIDVNSVNDLPFINQTILDQVVSDEASDSLDLDLTGYAFDINDSDTNLQWSASGWNASLWQYVDNSVTDHIVFKPIENVAMTQNLTDDVTIIVTDSYGDSVSQDITITIVPYNDEPSQVQSVGRMPSNDTVQTPGSHDVTLDWVDSTDPENDAVIYHVFFGTIIEPEFNATVTDSEITMMDLADGTIYYWYVIASDGQRNATKSETWQFTTSFDNVPTITSYEPSASIIIQETETLLFNATLNDVDGDLITYNWTLDGILQVEATTSSSNEIVSFAYTPSYSDSGLHIVELNIMDANGNVGSPLLWTVTVDDMNRAPVINAISNQAVDEGSLLIFDITGYDLDSNTLTYTCNLTDLVINYVNDNRSTVTWTPDDNDVGVYDVTCTVSDLSLSDSEQFTITVNDVNDVPVITDYTPAYDPTISDNTGLQHFTVTATDADIGDTLTITWYEDGTSSGSGSSYDASSLSAGIYNITATVSDGEAAVDQTWTLTVTDRPVSNLYTGTILTVIDLSNATGVTIVESTYGQIDFGGNIINLEDVADLDPYVNISQGVIGIDTSMYPSLDASATLTLRGLTYDRMPLIYYNTAYSTTGMTECPVSVCWNADYDVGTGVLTFEATGFNIFWTVANVTNQAPVITSSPRETATIGNEYRYDVDATDVESDPLSYSLITYPTGMTINTDGRILWTPNATGNYDVVVQVSDGINEVTQSYDIGVADGSRLSISEVNVKVDGSSDKDLEDGDTIDEEASPGSDIEFEINIENLYDDNDDIQIEDIEVEVVIQDIDDGDDLEEQSSKFDLDPEEDKEVSLNFNIPWEVEEDTYDVLITVEGEDENGVVQEARIYLSLEVEKDKHEIKIRRIYVPAVSCDLTAKVDTSVINIGSEDEEEVSLKIMSPELGIDFSEDDIELEAGVDDNDYEKTFTFSLSEDIEVGVYPIEVYAYYDSKQSDSETVYLSVEECSSSSSSSTKKTSSKGTIYEDDQEVIVTVNSGSGSADTFASAVKSATNLKFDESIEFTVIAALYILVLGAGIYLIAWLLHLKK